MWAKTKAMKSKSQVTTQVHRIQILPVRSQKRTRNQRMSWMKKMIRIRIKKDNQKTMRPRRLLSRAPQTLMIRRSRWALKRNRVTKMTQMIPKCSIPMRVARKVSKRMRKAKKNRTSPTFKISVYNSISTQRQPKPRISLSNLERKPTGLSRTKRLLTTNSSPKTCPSTRWTCCTSCKKSKSVTRSLYGSGATSESTKMGAPSNRWKVNLIRKLRITKRLSPLWTAFMIVLCPSGGCCRLHLLTCPKTSLSFRMIVPRYPRWRSHSPSACCRSSCWCLQCRRVIFSRSSMTFWSPSFPKLGLPRRGWRISC